MAKRPTGAAGRDTGGALLRLYEQLDRACPPSAGWPDGEWPLSGTFRPPPLEVVVGAVLTQRTSWKNVEKALGRLGAANLTDADAIASCPLPFLEEVVRPSGFYVQKARRLRAVMEYVRSFPGDFFRDVERAQLLSVSGVGPETADSILLYACERPVFVIDAYTRRILSRFGLAREEAGYRELQAFFENHLPKEVPLFKRFHALLVEHAKLTCTRRPACFRCTLRENCGWFSGVGPWE